tara:strand:+ start:809 stop:1156 length:348 start_codon:yes stop_codon:yes gene_type:complete
LDLGKFFSRRLVYPFIEAGRLICRFFVQREAIFAYVLESVRVLRDSHVLLEGRGMLRQQLAGVVQRHLQSHENAGRYRGVGQEQDHAQQRDGACERDRLYVYHQLQRIYDVLSLV